jgi:energy-coupling factor transporter ATP-binding protein EcfA2
VLLLDEPTSGLDATTAAELMGVLRDLAGARGLTIVASVHAPSETVFEAFDQLLLLSKGRLVYGGAPAGAPGWLRRAAAAAGEGGGCGGGVGPVLSVGGAEVVSEIAYKVGPPGGAPRATGLCAGARAVRGAALRRGLCKGSCRRAKAHVQGGGRGEGRCGVCPAHLGK